MQTEIEKIKAENETVLSFIKNWQSKNDYNPIALNEYNAKFKVEMNHFLSTKNFSKETIDLFICE